MTPEHLAEIRARLDAATPGPWLVGKAGSYCHGVYAAAAGAICDAYGKADCALIANAPADLAALLAYVAELEGLLRDLCHDSLAAEEVVRLRKAVGEIAAACERRTAGGYLLAPGDVARHLHDALAPHAPDMQKPGGA